MTDMDIRQEMEQLIRELEDIQTDPGTGCFRQGP